MDERKPKFLELAATAASLAYRFTRWAASLSLSRRAELAMALCQLNESYGSAIEIQCCLTLNNGDEV